MAIEDKLERMYCPSCRKQTNFNYIGMQLGRDESSRERKIIFYNCGSCNTTLNKDSIEDFTRQVRLASE